MAISTQILAQSFLDDSVFPEQILLVLLVVAVPNCCFNVSLLRSVIGIEMSMPAADPSRVKLAVASHLLRFLGPSITSIDVQCFMDDWICFVHRSKES
jgi:hypothetical protein